MSVSEKDVETALVKNIEKQGGKAYKFVSSVSGVPDRICLLPKGKIVFVELKAPGKKPSALQLVVHKQIQKLGFRVLVIDNLEDARKTPFA